MQSWGKGWHRKAWRTTLLLPLAILLGVFALLFVLLLTALSSAQNIDKLQEAEPAPTVIYDAGGEVAAEVAMSKTERVDLEEVPKSLTDAIIAVEDRRFHEHRGMDLIGIARAAVQNALHGGTVQGGSTLTQQLAKNVFLTHERTFARKWKELLLAKKIEADYSKEEILEMYVNRIYFGEGAWGVKKAAAVYFGKQPQELTLSESAMLAGLLKAPSVLSPYKNPEQAMERRDLVLGLMKSQDLISGSEYDEALREEPVLRSAKEMNGMERKYPYYTDYVIQEAEERYGLTQNEVLYGGLEIYTEMNPGMQQAAETVYASKDVFPAGSSSELVQSGMAMIDPATGGIRAMVGGRGETVFRGFNRAAQLKRQPGSTIKPLAVYAPALEQGYDIFSMLDDKPVDFAGYGPENADGRYRGTVSLYEALVHSYNVPAVSLMNEIGVSRGVDSVERFGISLLPEDRTLALALGGLSGGTSPLRMAQAYSAFANEGVMHEAHAIRKIVIPGEGRTLEMPVKTTQVISAETAGLITAMLLDVVADGTGQAAAIPGRQIAGKTGTTQIPGGSGSGAKDNWFVGYTPQLVTAVWLGYDRTDENTYLTTSSRAAAAVFRRLMEEALRGMAPVPFAGITAPHGFKDTEKEVKQKKKKKKDERKWERERDKRKEKEREKGRGRDRDD